MTSSLPFLVVGVHSTMAPKAAKAKIAADSSQGAKRRPVADTVAVSTDQEDSLWQPNPCLAAFLALVPLQTPDRARSLEIGEQTLSPHKDDDRIIERTLPPALQELKVSDTWTKETSVAINNYLKSLQTTHGFDVEGLLKNYEESKPAQKRDIGKMLVLSKTGTDLRGWEHESLTDRTTSSSKRGLGECVRGLVK